VRAGSDRLARFKNKQAAIGIVAARARFSKGTAKFRDHH
jgi:hypothetical protein